MISLSRCELVIDFLGQLFCVLNEILYFLLVSEFCEPCLTDECTKARRPSFECSFCSKAIDILKELLDSSFYLFVLDIFIFIQDEMEGIRSQNGFCFCPFLRGLFLILCMVSTTHTFLVLCS